MQRAVLAILLLHANEAVTSDRLVEALWAGDPPASAAKSLQVHVSRLRRALGSGRRDDGERLVTAAGGYLLRVLPGELDGERCERLLEEGHELAAAGRWELAEKKLREALELWRGQPLSEFEYESFAQAEIARLSELRMVAVEQRIDAELALGRGRQVIGELELLVRAHPYREQLRGRLMLALYRSGRQAEALEAYRDARSALVQELGIEPSAELRELHAAILAQEASLRPSVASRAAGIDGDSLFVGYERELGVLERALERTFASCGSVVLIAGEPGIGKSCVAGQIGERARSRGARVLWGRCWEAGGAPAYWPWVQALRSYVADCSDDELRELAGAGVTELAQIVPELRDRLPDVGGGDLVGSDDARFRLFEAIAGLVRRAGTAKPLVFILDDLHAADEPSVLLLRYLADAVADSRVLIVTAYRDTELSEEHPLRATITELDRRGGCAQIVLKGFGPGETARLVQRSTGERAFPLLASAIHRSSDGNPLFVTELVRLLEAEGKLIELTDAEALQLPAGLDEVIERWLRRLSAGCRRTLATAAVIGRAFDLETLARACEASETEMVAELEEAIAAHLVADAPGAPGRLRFSHDLVREAFYRRLSSVRRRRLHVAVGEALEHVYAGNVEPHLAELAHHFFSAASRGQARKAIEYARRAAERAAAVLAYEEAVRLYGLALETIEWSDAGRETERAELSIELADELALAGDVGRARPALAQAASEAQRVGDAHLGARAALLRSEIETIAGSDTAGQAIEWADAALAFFQQSGDDVHQARAWGVKSLRNHGIGREVAAAQEAEQMLACARRADSQALEAKAMTGSPAAWPTDRPRSKKRSPAWHECSKRQAARIPRRES